MSEQESWRATREAGGEIGRHPERPGRHEEALSRYLGGAAYRERHMSRPRSRVTPGADTPAAAWNPPWWAAPLKGRGPQDAGTAQRSAGGWVRRLFSRRRRQPQS